MRKKIFCVGIFVVFLLSVNNAFSISIGLIGAEPDNGVVTGYLSGTCLFDSICYIDVQNQTPDLNSLNQYDFVMVWSNWAYHDATKLGNNLADYVDDGGGVVLASFNFSDGTGFKLEGRIMTDTSYSPFSAQSSLWSDSSFGTYDACHPIMAGINSLTAIGGFRDDVDLNPGATLLASWNDGNELLAYNHEGQVVGITLYPGESFINGLGRDYAQIFGNSLVFCSSGNTVPQPATMLQVGTGLIGLAGI